MEIGKLAALGQGAGEMIFAKLGPATRRPALPGRKKEDAHRSEGLLPFYHSSVVNYTKHKVVSWVGKSLFDNVAVARNRRADSMGTDLLQLAKTPILL